MSLRLKRGLEQMLKKYGHDILLQRKTDNGYDTTLERHTVRHWFPGSPDSTMGSMPEGLVNTVDMIYAAKVDMRPKERDRIYERDEGLGEQSVYLIDYAVPMRGFAGEIVYWLIGVTREGPN